MPKPNPFKKAKGSLKSIFSPSSPPDPQSTTVNGRNSAQGNFDTGIAENGTPDDNLLLSRLRQQGIITPTLPAAMTASTSNGSIKQNAVLPNSGAIFLPSSLKLERFRQQVAKTLSDQTSSSTSSTTARKDSVFAPFSKTPLITTKLSDPKASQTKLSPSSGVLETTPEVEQLTEMVAKLPDGFPISEWDSMTAQQRLLAARSSGLSQQEQWQLLNASRSLSTIAAIQDIQSNFLAYGLSAQEADKLTTDLITIDNACTSVKNHETPFATDMQRSIFLTQLDKEEQKLLDTVDRHKRSDRDTLLDKGRTRSSDKPRKTSVPKVITEIDINNKLASVAKDVLKGYIGIQYILPASLSMLSLEGLCKLIDQGTITIGASLTGVALIGGTGNVGVVMDMDGDIGIIYTYGGYSGTPSASIVAFASISSADDLADLNGQSFEVGGSGGEVVTIGGEFCTFVGKQSEKTSFAVNLNVGVGITPPMFPAEGHAGIVNSIVDEKFNLFDAWTEFVEGYIAW